jgi:hypothetical protein
MKRSLRMKALVLKTVETLEIMDVPAPKLQPGG